MCNNTPHHFLHFSNSFKVRGVDREVMENVLEASMLKETFKDMNLAK